MANSEAIVQKGTGKIVPWKNAPHPYTNPDANPISGRNLLGGAIFQWSVKKIFFKISQNSQENTCATESLF